MKYIFGHLIIRRWPVLYKQWLIDMNRGPIIVHYAYIVLYLFVSSKIISTIFTLLFPFRELPRDSLTDTNQMNVCRTVLCFGSRVSIAHTHLHINTSAGLRLLPCDVIDHTAVIASNCMR